MNANRTTTLLTKKETCSNHEFLLQQLKITEKLHSKTVAWSIWKDMRDKCVERFCEQANKKTEQLYKVATPCLDDQKFKKEELETVGGLSNVCSQMVLKILYLARIGRLDIL